MKWLACPDHVGVHRAHLQPAPRCRSGISTPGRARGCSSDCPGWLPLPRCGAAPRAPAHWPRLDHPGQRPGSQDVSGAVHTEEVTGSIPVSPTQVTGPVRDLRTGLRHLYSSEVQLAKLLNGSVVSHVDRTNPSTSYRSGPMRGCSHCAGLPLPMTPTHQPTVRHQCAMRQRQRRRRLSNLVR